MRRQNRSPAKSRASLSASLRETSKKSLTAKTERVSYKALYEYCQNATPPVSRKLIKPKVEELCGGKICIFMTEMNQEFVHGLFLSPTNKEHRFAQQAHGAHVVVVGRGLNKALERFVTVKEMMHVFDDELHRTNS